MSETPLSMSIPLYHHPPVEKVVIDDSEKDVVDMLKVVGMDVRTL